MPHPLFQLLAEAPREPRPVYDIPPVITRRAWCFPLRRRAG
jgi:hypothetical protein